MWMKAKERGVCGSRGGRDGRKGSWRPGLGVPRWPAMDTNGAASADDVLITGARVFDGVRLIEADSVLVRGGIVEGVGGEIAAPDGVTTVDGGGGTLLPGLIDAHTHVTSTADLRVALAFGVTTELDMFCPTELLREIRAAVAGRVDHADFRSAGVGATAPGGHPTQLVTFGIYPEFPLLTDPSQAEAFVADRVAEGSDYFKIFLEDDQTFGWNSPRLGADVVRAVVAAAHDAGLLVVAHVSTRADADLAIEAGVNGLVHVFIDGPPDAGFAQRAADAGIFVTPTLSVYEAYTAPVRRERTFIDHPRMGPYLDAPTRAVLTTDPDGDYVMKPPPGVSHEHAFAATRGLRDAGVPVLAGTDAATGRSAHGFCVHGELAALVDAGLSAAEALRAATAAPAEAFKLTDRGRIAPGMRGDLLLVDGDPTVDIAATRDIRGIWARGFRFDREAYRESLATEA